MQADHILCDLVLSHYVVIRAGLQSAGGFPKARSGPTSAHGVPVWHQGDLRIEPWKLQCSAADEHQWLPWRSLMLLQLKERALAAAQKPPENEWETSGIENRPSAPCPTWSFNFLFFPLPFSENRLKTRLCYKAYSAPSDLMAAWHPCNRCIFMTMHD